MGKYVQQHLGEFPETDPVWRQHMLAAIDYHLETETYDRTVEEDGIPKDPKARGKMSNHAMTVRCRLLGDQGLCPGMFQDAVITVSRQVNTSDEGWKEKLSRLRKSWE